ncbi:hypothetical protein [Sulfitobacter sp.]|uniref:hypothetical protein n=1 Tax=Sulfitobacter sp. TaxID=1903071 RepID=UPI003EFA55C7
MINKEKIISLLEQTVSTNIGGSFQYESRFKGFIGELDFPRFASQVWPGVDLLPGGFLVSPISDARSTINPIHFNISTREPSDFLEIYKRLANLGCSALFYFQFEVEKEVENWTQNEFSSDFISPPYKVYEYRKDSECFEISSKDTFCSLFEDKSKIPKSKKIPDELKKRFRAKLVEFSQTSLAELYFQRLVFDTLVGGPKVHGSPSDIDYVAHSKRRNGYVILEVKEKDPSKGGRPGFGMDVPRIEDFIEMQSKTGMRVFYIVREITDQKSRKFLRWRSIKLDTFISHLGGTIQGGTGMGPKNDKNPTKICPVQHFDTIE